MSGKRKGYPKFRALTVPCPKCGVYERRLCVKKDGSPRKAFHVERHRAAAVAPIVETKAKQREYTKEWAILRARVFAEKGSQCVYCGADAWHVDHQQPRSRGGTDDISNLVPACDACNEAKGTLSLEEWNRVRQ